MFIIYTLLILLTIIFSPAVIESAKVSIELFIYNIAPSLFPFFVLTNLLSTKGKSALISGFLCGYPAGAIACGSLLSKNRITKSQAEFYSSFINNAGPAFIIGTIGVVMCNSFFIGVFLLISHLLASFTIMLIFSSLNPSYKVCKTQSSSTYTPNSVIPIGEQLTNSITSAVKQIAVVGGYIVFFSVIISIICAAGFSNTYLFGFLEVTTGISYIIGQLSPNNFRHELISELPLISFFLGWSGLSIHAQIIAILNKNKIRASLFFFGKLIQAVLSGIYTFLFLKIPQLANYLTDFDLPVFHPNEHQNFILKKNTLVSPVFLLFETIFILLILSFFIRRKLIARSL